MCINSESYKLPSNLVLNKTIHDCDEYPPVSIGVVTHENSFVDFTGFLIELKSGLTAYPGDCHLIVVNNSGEVAAARTCEQLERSDIKTVCNYTLVASSENNIATGRNEVLNCAEHPLVAFLDDDEFPTIHWLTHLVYTMKTYRCAIVAGPALPLYLFETPKWVRQVNLHGARGKTTGQRLRKCATANVLIDMEHCAPERFDPDYGHSGGEDTDFFLRLTDNGHELRWCNEAEIYEYIPANKSTHAYMIKRSILQGVLNRRILIARRELRSVLAFKVKSFATALVCFSVGGLLTCAQHQHAGDWIKRGFGNIGHLLSSDSKLYN